MTLPATIEDIRVYLSESSTSPAQEFSHLLTEALSGYDLAQIQRLVTAAEPFVKTDPDLEQWTIYALGLLALEEQQQPEEAITQFEKLRKKKTQLVPGLAGRVLNSLGITYEKSEQWDRALQCYQECIDLCEVEQDFLGLGKAYSNLAIVHYKGLDYDAAAQSAQRAIAILEQQPQDRTWQIPLARAWNEVGLAYLQLGNLTEAQIAFEQYLTLSQQWDYEWGQGVAYNNLAHTYRKLGDVVAAEKYYKLACELSLKVDNTFEAAEATYGLGLVSKKESASGLFDKALNLALEANNHEITTQIYLSRANLAAEQGNTETALDETRQAVETVESLRTNIVLPEARIRLQGSRIEAYQQMVSRLCEMATPSAYREAFKYAEMAKSRAFIEMLTEQPVRRPQNVPEQWLEREIELRQSLRVLYEDPTTHQEQISTLEAELAQLREQIRLRDAEFGSFQTVDPISLDEVMSRLPQDGVLLEYFTAGEIIWAFVVTKQSISVTRLPLKAQELERAFLQTNGKLGQLRNLTRDPDFNLHQPWILEKLYRLLLEPLGKTVQSASVLCIVPDGLLHYVPFHALYQNTDIGIQYFNNNQRRIVYAPSANTLFDYCQQKASTTDQRCLAIGYNEPSLNLSQAEAEAKAISQITGGTAYVGEAAKREILLKHGMDYGYIHISCHGWFNPVWPMASSLSLADGPLDVTDILHNLQLQADLVSLSACETGRSHILQGDELIGLVRAFLYAGTPSVLVSQWVVDELSTRLLMDRFYEAVMHPTTNHREASKAQALTQAQNFIQTLTVDQLRQVLADTPEIEDLDNHLQYLAVSGGYGSVDQLKGDECLFAHPYYWASFYLIGDQLA